MTAHTIYRPIARRPWAPPVALPPHLGLVAVSRHQSRHGIGLPWVAAIHPAVPVSEPPLTVQHAGPCVYLGPLHAEHGAAAALTAAHQAGRPIVLAGTTPDREAAAVAGVKLAARLAAGDQLVERVRVSERWELLALACCLLARCGGTRPSAWRSWRRWSAAPRSSRWRARWAPSWSPTGSAGWP